jgi:hypothetical protein
MMKGEVRPTTSLGNKPGLVTITLRMLPVFVMDSGDVHTGESIVGVVPSRVQWSCAPAVAVEMLILASSVKTPDMGLSSGGDARIKNVVLVVIALFSSMLLPQIALMIVSVCCSRKGDWYTDEDLSGSVPSTVK